MLVKALRPFPYSSNGIAVRHISSGEEFDCRDDIVEGLLAEKFVQRSAGAKSLRRQQQKSESASVPVLDLETVESK